MQTATDPIAAAEALALEEQRPQRAAGWKIAQKIALGEHVEPKEIMALGLPAADLRALVKLAETLPRPNPNEAQREERTINAELAEAQAARAGVIAVLRGSATAKDVQAVALLGEELCGAVQQLAKRARDLEEERSLARVSREWEESADRKRAAVGARASRYVEAGEL